ncbi:hypothetical protein [Cronobacter dublinensis]|uniref:hypothetical protein n=1 Tax=Cronobacter dublinensis TaxID=413497 RepID=UPI001319C30B|nr:hypothetical protein [Cronobacter dublinensis]
MSCVILSLKKTKGCCFFASGIKRSENGRKFILSGQLSAKNSEKKTGLLKKTKKAALWRPFSCSPRAERRGQRSNITD